MADGRGGKVDNENTVGRGHRGVKSRIFGVVLISLGALNSMLTMKGGFKPDPFNYLLIIAGVLFVLTGILRDGRRTS